jgi:6-phosphofructokinase 1
MNSVISAATIEAVNTGWEVVGILDGFEHLIRGDTSQVVLLDIERVSRIHPIGGTILFTSRANPTVRDEGATDPEWRLTASLGALAQLGIDALITIGGEDTAYSAKILAQRAGGRLKVVHVPKTIDNDLPLPAGMPTFGFETARHVGVNLVSNLMSDAMSTKRWFFVVAMGRSAGHLALGIGKASGATLSVIPEEFDPSEPIALSEIVDLLECAMLKRLAHGKPYGVAVLAEGLGERLPKEELLTAAPDIEMDEHGHIRLEELNLQVILVRLVGERFRQRGRKVTIVSKNIGYELRSAPPIPFDVDYTRDLGWGAIDYLRKLVTTGSAEEVGAMITLQDGVLVPLDFGSFDDPETGRIRVRRVDPAGTTYRVAREYMIRLEVSDLEDPEKLAQIAEAAGMTPEAFASRYGYILRKDLGAPR